MDRQQENPAPVKVLPTYNATIAVTPDKSSHLKSSLGETVLDKARQEGNMRARFWNMLVDYVPRSGFTPPQDRSTSVLHVGCGKAAEADIITGYFGGGRVGSNSDGAELVGVDIDNEVIQQAISKNSLPSLTSPTTYELPDNMKFITGDATNLGAIDEVPEKVDVVVIRHQQVSENETTWKKIFAESVRRLRPSGLMILTSYSDAEHRILERAITDLGFQITVNDENKWGEDLQAGGAVSDKRIMIVRKI